MTYDLRILHAGRLKKPFDLPEIAAKIIDLKTTCGPSNRILAERALVSHQTVGRVLRKQKSDGAWWWAAKGRDQKVRGVGFSFLVQCAITDHPNLSDRAIGAAIGVSHQTVMRERRAMQGWS